MFKKTFKETVLSRSLKAIFAGGLGLAMNLAAPQAFAQDAVVSEPVQRIEITGSSIKRIAKEGALPVQTLSSADIQRSGAKSVEDLVQALPSMQGFTVSSESVNGGGGGVLNASIHSIGSGYTLVLLNGRRLASYGSGSAVNLASIPMTAVERVEILTDGASTLYGSDAIAGVINFILKKNQQDFKVEASYNNPTGNVGKSSSFSLSKGFGDLDKDGFNVLLSYAHDAQDELNAKDRSYASSGLQKFTEGGKTYSTYLLAANTAPASATISMKDNTVKIFSPSYFKTGKCGPNTSFIGSAADKSCWFDYSGTVQLIPKSKRDSFFASFNAKINDNMNFFAEAVASKFTQTARYAPAAQRLSLPLTSPLYISEVLPYLSNIGVSPDDVKSSSMNIRFTDAGGRARDYVTKAKHIAFGVNGSYSGFDYQTSFTHSENTQDSNFVGGFLSRNKYNSIVAAGQFNPFGPSGSAAAVLAPAVLHTNENTTTVKLDKVGASASHEVFSLSGGMAQIAIGADFTKQTYDFMPSAISQGNNPQQPTFTDTPLGDSAGNLPSNSTRNNWGTYAELVMPVMSNLEVTAATRYDSYSVIRNNTVFDLDNKLIGAADQGNANKKATYKLSLRYNPMDNLLVRGSYGTGFKVANMTAITNPISQAGNTSGSYACPVTAPDPRAAYCTGTTQQYLLSGGNPLKGDSGLKPEKSTQYTMGMRFDPVSNLSLGLDFWNVKMKDQITALPEQFPFKDPKKFDKNFSIVYDQGIGANILVTLLPTFNLGESRYQGIDWDHIYTNKTSFGKLSIKWAGTYMIQSEVDVPGAPTESSVGRFDAYNNVTSRVISSLSASLLSNDKYTNTLVMNYRSGYHDQVLTPDDNSLKLVNPDGSLAAGYVGLARDVKAFVTYDWQTRVLFKEYSNLALTFGVKNIFNKNPPLSIRTAGGGNQAGFDARYASAFGRQIYITGGASF